MGDTLGGADSSGDPAVAKAMAGATGVIDEYRVHSPHQPSATANTALRALITHLVTYLVVGAQGVPGYPKTIATFMARTDFAQNFQQLHWRDIQYFQKDRNAFVDLVMSAARTAAGRELERTGEVFEGGLYANPKYSASVRNVPDPRYQSPFPGLTRHIWLASLVHPGIDLLTSANWPGQRPEELESLGSLGKQMDTDLPGDRAGSIIELRGLPDMYLGKWLPFAMDIFRYVHTVNTGGTQPYPGAAASMTMEEDVAASGLAEDPAQVKLVRRKLVADALRAIQSWV